jgi:hypothetical protein
LSDLFEGEGQTEQLRFAPSAAKEGKAHRQTIHHAHRHGDVRVAGDGGGRRAQEALGCHLVFASLVFDPGEEATLRRAAFRAARMKSTFAGARCTLVAPRLPQAPTQGLKISGAFLTNFVCCSEFSLTMPCFHPGNPASQKSSRLIGNQDAPCAQTRTRRECSRLIFGIETRSWRKEITASL